MEPDEEEEVVFLDTHTKQYRPCTHHCTGGWLKYQTKLLLSDADDADDVEANYDQIPRSMGLLTRFIVSSGEDVLSSLFCAILQFASTMLFNRYGAAALTSFLCFFFYLCEQCPAPGMYFSPTQRRCSLIDNVYRYTAEMVQQPRGESAPEWKHTAKTPG